MTPRFSRRHFCQLGLPALGLAAAAGCAKFKRFRRVMRLSGGEIKVLMWRDYISADIIGKFQRDYGIDVIVTEVTSNEDLYDVLRGRDPRRPGPFDLAMTASYMAMRLQEEGLAAPFLRDADDNEFEIMTNLNPAEDFDQPEAELRMDNFDPRYNATSDPDNNTLLPYIWGAIAIGYNTDHIEQLPMSWADVFVKKPDRKRRIGIIDDGRYVLGTAVIYQLYQRYQGGVLSTQQVARAVARDFRNITVDEIRQAGELIKALGDEVVCITGNHVAQLLAKNEVNIAIARSADVTLAMLRGGRLQTDDQSRPARPNLNIRVSLPIEGIILFRDFFVIPRASPANKREQAQEFLNFLLEPAVAGAVTNYCCYATTVKGAAAIVRPEITNSATFFIHPYPDKNIYLERYHDQAVFEAFIRVWEDVKRSFPPGVLRYPPGFKPQVGQDLRDPEPLIQLK